MTSYLNIKTNEGNLPTLTFNTDRQSAVETFHKNALQLDKYSRAAYLYEVAPDGDNKNIATVTYGDSEFFNFAKKDTWYASWEDHPITMNTLDDDDNRTFREFLNDVITA